MKYSITQPKTKAEFEQWYKIQYGTQFGHFNDFPFPFQSGVYIKFFESKSLYVHCQRWGKDYLAQITLSSGENYDETITPDFHTALIAAFTAAADILEAQLIEKEK